jgi:hypothetical protein
MKLLYVLKERARIFIFIELIADPSRIYRVSGVNRR